MESNRSDLKFKGERRYLQSASVFDDLLDRLGQPLTDVDFVFHRQTANQVRYCNHSPSRPDELVATWRDGGRRIYIVDSGVPVTESEQYDEEALVSMLSFGESDVLVPEELGEFTFLEGVVAAFKHMLLRRDPARKKYVFARIKLKTMPPGTVTVRYVRTMSGFHQARILGAEETLGQLVYGEWQ